MTELKKHIENLPDDSKEPILALIEFKTDSDMEKVLDKIIGIKQELESKMTGIEQKLESKMTGIKQELESKMTGIEQKLESKIQTLDSNIQGLKANMDTQYRMLLWTVGVGISFIAILMAFFQLLK